MKRYNPKEIEPKWQMIWDENQVYQADLKSSKPKYFGMSMFNYPSGAGIHIGHAMNYTISDVMARVKRQQGFESYHPVGWDAFGLPAENYAIKSGVSPQASMAKIIPEYHKQYKAMGWSNDWSKEISTHEPEYYKWTQWIFSQMYKNGLAYQDSRMQWWCEKCQTVLANEQVEANGKCWRHDGLDDAVVGKKEVKQWFFKITDYADEILEATDALDWTESVKGMQKSWIGKSVGSEVDFAVDGKDKKITVFTTRIDTIFSAALIILAPEHELVGQITTNDNKSAVEEYVSRVEKKTEIERQAGANISGVFTGAYAVNPANDEKIPIWIADFVLAGYGTGAVFGDVHDERDLEFIRKYKIPARATIAQDFGKILPDEQEVEGSVVIGYDPKADKYLGLMRPDSAWLAGGGKEGNENFEQTAIRELLEETGFSEYEKVITLGEPVYSHYHNDIKKVNKRSYGQGFLFILDPVKAGDQHQESHEDFKPQWFEFNDLYKQIEAVQGGVEHWLEMLNRAKAAAEAFNNGEEFHQTCFTGEGILVDSGEYSGLASSEAREKITKKFGTEKINFKMRDWSVSRQRYWGAPIPIINCEKCGHVLVEEKDLPVVLPELVDFQPSGDGRSALARATDWLKVDCPKCGGQAERETDTLDTYICSSWYMLRYLDPKNDKKIFDSEVANRWMPVDFYNGGDHATAHMIYARFVTRFFYKLGLIDNPEPFKKFLFNGKVTASDGTMFSKSKGNGVDPLEIIDSGYGADALRTYLMFAAPLDLWIKWDPQGVPGAYRFLSRLWNLTYDFIDAKKSAEENKKVLSIAHKTIKKVTEDLEHQKYNTAIASMMGAVNDLYLEKTDGFKGQESWKFALESIIQCVAPFAPHIAEELWHELGHDDFVNKENWPVWDDAYLSDDNVTIAVQINGKVKAEIEVPKDSEQSEVEQTAKANEKITELLKSSAVKRTIYVPNKILNLVI